MSALKHIKSLRASLPVRQMLLSISIKESQEGFEPRLILRNLMGYHIIPMGTVCMTWKEAWILARLKRTEIRGSR